MPVWATGRARMRRGARAGDRGARRRPDTAAATGVVGRGHGGGDGGCARVAAVASTTLGSGDGGSGSVIAPKSGGSDT